MTPKEKAKELIDKFNNHTVKELFYLKNGKVTEGKTEAKECALIAVDEILLIAPMMHMEGFGNLTIREYYKKVKKETEKL